jgi:hypothetical protein
MSIRLVAAPLLLAACAHSVGPRQPPPPPLDPRERHTAEVEACAAGKLPAWLDDEALNAALDLDRREAQASVSNEAFHGATYVAQPPASTKPGPHATAIEDGRRAFQITCEASKRRTP